ncbi:MAG: hypothetical protein PF517_15580 [Salinivirgaceae bacterium]|nr:hypothetical protein [Salinivirgaceae bacterium]
MNAQNIPLIIEAESGELEIDFITLYEQYVTFISNQGSDVSNTEKQHR